MVTKKTIDELKKYNKELDKHIPKMDFDFLRSGKVFNETKINENQEFSTLLADNLFDLKTEIALLRKNLIDNVEGVVLRTIDEQQRVFFNQIDQFQNKVFVDMKNNFNGYIIEVTDELSGMKKEFNKMKLTNENYIEDIKELRESLHVIKNDRLSDSLNMKRDIFKALGEQNVQIDKSNKILSLKLNKINENQNLILKNSSSKIDLLADEISKIQKLEVSQEQLTQDYKNLKVEILPESNISSKISEKKVVKILDIESKLKKLESLK